MLSKQMCQKILFNFGLKLGVSPNLISNRLLSKNDKQDMVNGFIKDEALECHIKCWMEAGMPDYANGKNKPYKPSYNSPF